MIRASCTPWLWQCKIDPPDKHLDLWEIKERPPPRKQIGENETVIDYSHRGIGHYGPEAQSQLLPSDDYLYADPEPAFV